MKRQIHLKPEDLNKSDKLGLTYNLGQAHKRMLLKQSGIMQKFGLTAPVSDHSLSFYPQEGSGHTEDAGRTSAPDESHHHSHGEVHDRQGPCA